jgi:CRP/FNR family transcriptional regulator, cyclic AMP receptor protein
MVEYLPNPGIGPMSSTTLGERAASARAETPRGSAGHSAPSATATALAGVANLPSFRRLPFFAGVPDDALVTLAARSRWHVYAPGEVVVDSGDLTSDVFFVVEGAVRVVVRTALGYEAILNDLKPGNFFGELAAIDGVSRSANVTALQRTRLCAVPGPAFMEFALGSPVAGRRLMRMLAERLRAKDERLLELTALPVRQRLMAELLRMSRDRGNGERVLSPPPPQDVLARRIGTRRETVSREMAEMHRAELLSVDRRRRAIVLHRPEALQAEIESRLRGVAG